MSEAALQQDNLAALTAEIASAYLSHNHVQPDDLPSLIRGVGAKLAELATVGSGEPAPVRKLTPAEIKRSITPDYLISFEDGKRYKALRRHLTGRGLSPEAYREKWGLPVDYPMVASGYSARRAELAQAMGLGKHGRKAFATAAPADAQESDGSTP